MFNVAKSFGSFAVDDLEEAKKFYGETLGLDVKENEMGVLDVGSHQIIYPKPDFKPADFTVFNLFVTSIEAAVDELTGKGVTFEQYDMGEYGKTNAKGIMTGGGQSIAWFKDPAGNTLSLIEHD
jgi:catechol 2,3-dioxygenase-like lactoylglutathione lyase family enzyme